MAQLCLLYPESHIPTVLDLPFYGLLKGDFYTLLASLVQLSHELVFLVFLPLLYVALRGLIQVRLSFNSLRHALMGVGGVGCVYSDIFTMKKHLCQEMNHDSRTQIEIYRWLSKAGYLGPNQQNEIYLLKTKTNDLIMITFESSLLFK